jgi:hypothetical protein
MHTWHCCWVVPLALVSGVTVRGSCENASVFDKSNGIFAVKQNSYLYTVSTAEGTEMNLIFYFPACISWAQWHVLFPRVSSSAVFYGTVSHNWITVATVDLACIAHLRIRMQSIKMCWTFVFIITFLPNGFMSPWYSIIMFGSSRFLSQLSHRLFWGLKWILSAPSEKIQDCVTTGSRMLHS